MLEIKNLTKRYDETIIKNLNIILPSTGLIIIVGNSGCGKTTLLNLIGGIDQDYEGEILFDHQDIRKIKKYCRRHIGFIFQDFNFLIGEVLYLSVIEKTKDIGIFKCMGASKLQIMNLVLLESFTLVSGAFICSYVFFYQLVNLINQLVENELQLDLSGAFIQIDYQLVIVIYLGALCFGLCSSYIPAFLAGRLDPIKALKQPNY